MLNRASINADGRIGANVYSGADVFLSLDGVVSPEWFKITNIDIPVLPSVSLTTDEVSGRYGKIIQSSQLDAKTIKVSFRIENPTTNFYSMDSLKRILAGWLSMAIRKDVELIISSDVKIKYKVRLTGEVDLKRIFLDGEGDINFYASDPIGVGEEHKFNSHSKNNGSTPMQIPYNGTCETYPLITFTLIKDITGLQMVSDEGYVELGQPLSVDDIVDTYYSQLLYDNCTQFNGWVKSNSVYGGEVTNGTWELYKADALRPSKGDDVGTLPEAPKGWFGSVYEKGFNSTATNFKCSFNFTIHTNYKNKKTMGRIQTILKDENGKDFIILRGHDNKSGVSGLYFDIGLINEGGTKWIVSGYKVKDKYRNFYGNMNIKRENNVYRYELNYVSKGKSTRMFSGSYTDGGKVYANRKPKVFQCAFLKYKDNPLCEMRLSHVDIDNLDKRVKPDGSISIIARAGDTITINNETGDIYKNDSIWLKNLVQSSTYISLSPSKINGLILSPDEITDDISITFTDRYY